MASGVLKALSFTSPYPGTLELCISYEAQGISGGDWGSAISCKAFMTQNSSTLFGDPIPVATSQRLPGVVQAQFPVLAGATVTCGLYGSISGAVALIVWNVKINAEFIKA